MNKECSSLSSVPATKWDVARVAAESSLSLRQMISALLVVQLGHSDELIDKVEELSKRADEMWRIFRELAEVSDDT
jgi:hypothetical protein